MWNIYTAEFYSVVRENPIIKHVRKWMDSEFIILNKINQAQKCKHSVFSLVWVLALNLYTFPPVGFLCTCICVCVWGGVSKLQRELWGDFEGGGSVTGHGAMKKGEGDFWARRSAGVCRRGRNRGKRGERTAKISCVCKRML